MMYEGNVNLQYRTFANPVLFFKKIDPTLFTPLRPSNLAFRTKHHGFLSC